MGVYRLGKWIQRRSGLIRWSTQSVYVCPLRLLHGKLGCHFKSCDWDRIELTYGAIARPKFRC